VIVWGLAALPSAVALAAYNAAAFGSPFRLSYRYVAEQFAVEQSKGLFGIGIPDPVQLAQVLVWSQARLPARPDPASGLLIQSPILVLGAVGLGLLWRRGMRSEAALCGSVALVLILLTSGYYDPVGGLSPGARFFTPALPFLAVGLPCAFRRWPYLTLGATAVSIGFMLFRAGTWNEPVGGSFQTIWYLLGGPKAGSVVLLGAFTITALMIASWSLVGTVEWLALRLRGGSDQGGLTFAVLFRERQIAEARFVPVWDGLPRLASYELGPAYPHSPIELDRLEPLAAEAITDMLRGSPEEQATAWAGGFVDVPASGARRLLRPRENLASEIALARRALGENHGTDEPERRIERARKRGVLVGDDFTDNAEAVLSRVDEAKREILKLLDTRSVVYVADLVDALTTSIQEIEAALTDLAAEGSVELAASDEEFREQTGFAFSSVSRRSTRTVTGSTE
jgi:hypothetical protein